MPLLNAFMTWVMKQRMTQIHNFMQNPHDVQEQWFAKLIESAKDTEWGKKYDYSSIKNRKEFAERVPLQNYDTMKPFIERQMKGEQNLLWNSEIKWFAKSSGTTSDKSKFIPVSIEALEDCHYKGGKDVLAIYCSNYPDTNIFKGKCLGIGGSSYINSVEKESYFGDISAVIMQNLPFWAEYIRTPEISIALMSDWEKKLEKMALVTVNENVTMLSGVPTWTLLLLKKILDENSSKTLLDIWPNLEVFIHGAVNFTPYREPFRKLIPSSRMNYIETYNASEGFFGIQDKTDSEELLLMLDYGVFYEFIPMDNFADTDSKTISLEEVKTGKNYAMVISTNGGLWRYIIGDTVRFTSINPYRILITGRTRSFINAFGEEIVVENAENAIKSACDENSARVRDYTAAPVYFSDTSNGAHEWLIEFEEAPSDLGKFVQSLDSNLQKLNSDYEAKRAGDIALGLPVVHSLPENTFYNWLKSKGKLGGQNKVPRLANDRKYVEEILTFAKEKR